MSKDRLLQGTRVYGTELISGVTLWTGLAGCIGVLLLAASLNVEELLPGWADPLNLALTTVAFQAPLASAAASLATLRTLKGGMAQISATCPGGQVRALIVSIGVVASWFVLANTLLTIVILLRSDTDGASSMSMLLLPLSGLVTVVTAIAIGAWVGELWRSGWAPIISALAVFSWIYLLPFVPSWERTSPIYAEIYYQVFLEPNQALVLAQVAAMASCSVLLFGRVLRRNGTGAAWSKPLWIAIAVASVFLVAHNATKPTVQRAAPHDPPCIASDRVTLCVWPESTGRQDQLLHSLTDTLAAAEGFFKTPRLFLEVGLSTEGQGPNGTWRHVRVPTPYEEDYSLPALQAVAPPDRCGSEDSVNARFDLLAWLEARALGQPTGAKAIDRVLKRSKIEQQSWVKEKVRVFTECE